MMDNMVDQCREMMWNMMGGGTMDGMMGSSVLFPILAAVLLLWLIGLAVLAGLGVWAVRRFAR